MATVTSTPSGNSLTINGATSVTGTILWEKPTVPDNVIISSCVLTGAPNISINKGNVSIKINGNTITVGTKFNINLGTDINITSVAVTAKSNNKNSRGTISFSNLLYTVEYTINKYTVIFKDWNGTTLDTQSIEYGSSATAPDNPSREGYTFDRWDTDYSSVKSNLIVTAIYTINTYTITFKDYNETTLKIQTVEYVSSLPAIDLLYQNLTNIVSVLYMFARYSSITSITFNQNCSFEKLESIRGILKHCTALTKTNFLDILYNQY